VENLYQLCVVDFSVVCQQYSGLQSVQFVHMKRGGGEKWWNGWSEWPQPLWGLW